MLGCLTIGLQHEQRGPPSTALLCSPWQDSVGEPASQPPTSRPVRGHHLTQAPSQKDTTSHERSPCRTACSRKGAAAKQLSPATGPRPRPPWAPRSRRQATAATDPRRRPWPGRAPSRRGARMPPRTAARPPPPQAAARQKVLERRRSPRLRRRAPCPHRAAAAPRGRRRVGEGGGGGDGRPRPSQRSGGERREGWVCVGVCARDPRGGTARPGFRGNRPPSPYSRSKEELPPTLRKARTRLREWAAARATAQGLLRSHCDGY